MPRALAYAYAAVVGFGLSGLALLLGWTVSATMYSQASVILSLAAFAEYLANREGQS